MSIFKSVKNVVVNSALSVVDTTRGIASVTVTAITNNKATQAISKAKAIGRSNRELAKAEKLVKQLKKLQTKMHVKPDTDF